MHAKNLDGEGAKIYGGRWNEPGIPCIYTSESRALSLLEYSCHAELHLIPRTLSFITYEIPEHSIKTFKVGELPGNWKHSPHPKEPRGFGTEFLQANQFLVYGLPSVVIEEEMNFIINPSHPDFDQVKLIEIKDYVYDIRLKAGGL